MAFPKLALLWEIQITCLSDTNVVRQTEMSRGGIPPLGPIWIKKQKTVADNTGDKSSITPREIEKEKDIYSEFDHNRTQKFSEIGIRNYWRRNGFRKRGIKEE